MSDDYSLNRVFNVATQPSQLGSKLFPKNQENIKFKIWLFDVV